MRSARLKAEGQRQGTQSITSDSVSPRSPPQAGPGPRWRRWGWRRRRPFAQKEGEKADTISRLEGRGAKARHAIHHQRLRLTSFVSTGRAGAAGAAVGVAMAAAFCTERKGESRCDQQA